MRDPMDRLDIPADSAEAYAVLADPAEYRRRMARDIEQLATEAEVPVEVLAPRAGRILPAVPDWVENRAKWVTLSRADRRALERHHRKQQRR